MITTIDGKEHYIGKWDLLIAHPPCTYLTNCATRSFSLRVTPADKVVKRWEDRALAACFFMQFVCADIPKICVENPIGFMSKAYGKPTQIIHPYMFAESTESDEYVTKATCLWLKGLEPLKGNDLPKPNNKELYGVFPSGKVKLWEDQTHGSTTRSKTFYGVAKAMAEQWG